MDSYNAEECGSNLAIIKKYSYEKDLSKELIEDLKKSGFSSERKDRIYIMYKNDYGEYKSGFLIGKRHVALWVGFHNESGDFIEEDADKILLVDTGYWYALYDKQDQYSKDAELISNKILNYTILIPFPSLYETINTKFVKNKNAMMAFCHFIKNYAILYDDSDYKIDAFEECFKSQNVARCFSLVDLIIRKMLEDEKLKINGLITFNERDFIDICAVKNIEIISR